GNTDCDDSECKGVGYCAADMAGEDTVSCTDGFDNDGDGIIDCLDSDCIGDAACIGESDDTTCSDGMDNDNDGRVDCADSDCYLALDVTVCSLASTMPCSDTNPQGTCPNAGEVCTEGGICALGLDQFTIGTDDTLLITEFMPSPDGLDS